MDILTFPILNLLLCTVGLPLSFRKARQQGASRSILSTDTSKADPEAVFRWLHCGQLEERKQAKPTQATQKHVFDVTLNATISRNRLISTASGVGSLPEGGHNCKVALPTIRFSLLGHVQLSNLEQTTNDRLNMSYEARPTKRTLKSMKQEDIMRSGNMSETISS